MLVNRFTVRIEWADCDPAGIVYYPRYFAMFDTATHHLFEAAGWKKRDLIANSTSSASRWSTRAPNSRRPQLRRRHRHRNPRRRLPQLELRHRAQGLKLTEAGEQLAIEAWETRVWVGAPSGRPGAAQVAPDPAAGDRALVGRSKRPVMAARRGKLSLVAESAVREGASEPLDLSALNSIVGYPLRRAQLAVFDDFNRRFAALQPFAGAIFDAGGDRRQCRAQAIGNRRRARHPAAELRRHDGRA